ncbi:sterol desaturase family protein [Rosistilla oblonga]|uniref:sterol desaturase family protein n=1 Tax=Rosistilla oblonga TaxID=2527990 RepID=UPI003A9740EE
MNTANTKPQQLLHSPPAGAEYRLFGAAGTGGAYNSHFVAGAIFIGLAAVGAIDWWLAIWLDSCLAIGLLLDRRTMNRKLALRAMPGQMLLYSQVALRAAVHLLPYYLFAFVLYLGMAPVILPLNFAISSFAMLYGFYMAIRIYWLVRYLWVLHFHWERAGRTFQTHQANLKTRSSAIRHVLWAFFLGNVGLVVRCSSQVITIAGFEYLRQRMNLDLTKHPDLSGHMMTIFWGTTAIWLATFWFALQPAFLIYYRVHRTFHTCRPLYDSVHSIHHRGVLPTQLDSGTISPLEFALTELNLPAATLVPNWYWTLGQIILALAGHFPSHDTNTWMKTGHHHLLHHRLFNVNFGLIAREDKRYGSYYCEPSKATAPSSGPVEADLPPRRRQAVASMAGEDD